MRDRALDLFRGLTIVQMFLYSLVTILSRDLPLVLRHNWFGRNYWGDFVLPFFLFASGMSVVHFQRKLSVMGARSWLLSAGHKILYLLFASAFITPFSAQRLFDMDEFMLAATLLVPALALSFVPLAFWGATVAAITGWYLLARELGRLPNFTEHYLGGYPAAPFFFIVVIIGMYFGRFPERITVRSAAALYAMTLLLMYFVAPWKMSASPSFMFLAAATSLLVFLMVKSSGASVPFLEYLGSHPARFWIMMFYFYIPLKSYLVTVHHAGVFGMHWSFGVLGSMACLGLAVVVSRGADLAERALSPMKPRPT